MDSQRPNIVLILADDMGFSDLGCYGSEIPTPNLDRLAGGGIRFTQMYNFARCCPSRAALLTGLNPHQAGIGHMTGGMPGPVQYEQYQGFLRLDCVTVAQVLQSSGYRTCMSGKWHVGENPADPGAPDLSSPRRRGFDRVFGIAGGCGSYYFCDSLWNDDEIVESEPGFYLTDAISDNAVRMIEESAALDQPFFQYVAYTAPHWPLHAPEEAVARHVGKYRKGWDAIRTARHEEMKGLGLVDSRWDISPRDEDVPPWGDAPDKEWEDLRMAVYAAQVEIMDQGIGRIVNRLESLGVLENTLVMFLSDNGGCAEFLEEDPALPGHRSLEIPGSGTTPDGRRVRTGNDPSIAPGPDDSYASYDVQWSNVSNTPFRRHKRWVHEGGISTPFIAHWPAMVDTPSLVHEPAQLIDITATCIDVAGASYPSEHNGRAVPPAEGVSLRPLIAGEGTASERPMFWEHEGHRAVRLGRWKLVAEYGRPWELYDVEVDRTELHDLSASDRDTVAYLSDLYREWAERCGVQPWENLVGPGRWVSIGMHPDGRFMTRGDHGHIVPLR